MEVNLKLPDGESQIGCLSDVFYVPSLAYNLLSVAKSEKLERVYNLVKQKDKSLMIMES